MRGKERAALRAGKAPRERGTFVRIIGEVDRPFLLIVIALLCIGSVMVFSASYAYGKYYFNDSYYFARRQLGWAVLGLAGMCFTAVVVDYRWIKRFAWLGYGVSLLLNAAVVVIGVANNGAQRWIKIGPIQFQPSELLKFFVIIVCASYISNNHSRMKSFRYGVLPFILILAPAAGLLVLQSHLSATIIVCLLVFSMMLLGGQRICRPPHHRRRPRDRQPYLHAPAAQRKQRNTAGGGCQNVRAAGKHL